MNFDPIRLEVRALPEIGYLKRRQILGTRETFGIFPFSESTWWCGVKSGRFPKPVYPFGPGEPLWRIEDIRALIVELARTDIAGEPIKQRKRNTDAPQSAQAAAPERSGEPQQQHRDDDQCQTTRERHARRPRKAVPA